MSLCSLELGRGEYRTGLVLASISSDLNALALAARSSALGARRKPEGRGDPPGG